jgi:frataxin
MDETEFHMLADATITGIEQDMEEADQDGRLDVEVMGGVLTLQLTDGKQYVISKHTPTRQVWVSSPVSGAHHFGYDAAAKKWVLASGQELRQLLDSELAGI